MQVRGMIETFAGFEIPGWIKSQDKSGFYVRAATSHTTRRYQFNRQVKSRRALCTRLWRQVLTSPQRIGWDSHAASNPVQKDSGRIVTLTGFQMFVRHNMTRFMVGLPQRLTQPGGAEVANATLTQSVALPLGLALYQFDNSESWTTSPVYMTIVADRGVVSPSWTHSKRVSRLIGFHVGNPPLGYPIPIVAARPFSPPNITGLILRTKTIRL